MDNLNREINRAQVVVNRLEQANQQDTEKYRYWHDRLTNLVMNRWTAFLISLESTYGPVALERRIIASGANQVSAYTEHGQFIQHINLKIIPLDIFDSLPILNDFRENNPACEHCGALGTELHHWAPQHLFEDASQWPTSYLCKVCHDEWHLKIQNHRKYGGVSDNKSD